MSAQLAEQLALAPSLLTDEHRTALAAVKTDHDIALFAWAVRELVHLGDARCGTYGDDAVALSQMLSKHYTSARALLKAWIGKCRTRMGLSELLNEHVDQLLDAQVIDFSTPDGFRIVASQFKQRSPTLSMETNSRNKVYRPSTPPAIAMGGAVSVHQ